MSLHTEALETRMSSVMRSGLRKAMSHVTILDRGNPLRDVVSALESYLYEPLLSQIRRTYAAGYTAGGIAIKQRKRQMMLAAAEEYISPERIDPRIAEATRSVLQGLESSIGNHEIEIRMAINELYEQGATLPQIASRMAGFFDGDTVAANRFARTLTTDVYVRAKLDRYEDSGVVDGVEYSAHIDNRTSDVCRMLHRTIWALDDPGIRTPPSHFNCRSDLLPYFGKIPGKRDYKKEFDQDFIDRANKTSDTFRQNYWSPMPRTKASAPYSRRYFFKEDSKNITDGLNLLIKDARKNGEDTGSFTLLKKWLRYRKRDPNTSVIVDQYGKSILLSKAERAQIRNAIKALIKQCDDRIAAYGAKLGRERANAWAVVESHREVITRIEQQIAKTTDATRLQELTDKLAERRTQEIRSMETWHVIDIMYTHQEDTATIINLNLQKAMYQRLLDNS